MQTINQILFSPSRSKIFALLGILTIVIAIPLTIHVVQRQQETRQFASSDCNSTTAKPDGCHCTKNNECSSNKCKTYNNLPSTKTCSGATPLEELQQAPKTSTLAQTVLMLSPNPLIVQSTPTTSHILNVDIQTNQNKITAVQVEIAYDPKAITNVDIFPGTFFTKPAILFKQIDTTRGRISYALGIQPTDEAVSGSGIVANISFTPRIKNQSTEFTFLPKTLVTSVGINESTLKSSKGTTVVLSP